MKNLVLNTANRTAQAVSKFHHGLCSAAKPLAFGILLAILLPAVNAHAEVIVFEYTGTGASGSLNGVAFTDVDFIFRAEGDNDDSAPASPGSAGLAIPHTSAEVDLGSLGTFQFTTLTQTQVNGTRVGFERTTNQALFNFDDPAFSGYDFLSSIGPISADADLLQWSNPGAPAFLDPPVNTDGGRLIFDTQTVSGTFTATVGTVAVPEPSSAVALFGLGGMGLLIRRRK